MLLLSQSVKPGCHKGTAYSATDLSIAFHAVMSSSVFTPNPFILLNRYILWFSFEQMCSVLADHFRSFVKITPKSLTLSTGWITLLFSFRSLGAVLDLLKLIVKEWHLFSLIIILSFKVSSNSISKACCSVPVGLPD